MSKHPSPRLDQLRAMREAQFASNSVRQKGAEKPAAPAAAKPAPAASPSQKREKQAAAKPKAKTANAGKTKAKTAKAKKAGG